MGRCKFVNTTMEGCRFSLFFISLVNYCSDHNDSKDFRQQNFGINCFHFRRMAHYYLSK
jgi:hypothetical protein